MNLNILYNYLFYPHQIVSKFSRVVALPFLMSCLCFLGGVVGAGWLEEITCSIAKNVENDQESFTIYVGSVWIELIVAEN